MFEFTAFTTDSSRHASLAIDLLRKPRLWIPTHKDYPGHEKWLEKVEAELQNGKKRAMLGLLGRQPVGAVIYQLSPEDPSTLEIRNITVSPDAGNRYIGSFLVRNSELEAVTHDFPQASRVVVDTKVNNSEMILFLQAHGYSREATLDLYDSGTQDAVMVKSLIGTVL